MKLTELGKLRVAFLAYVEKMPCKQLQGKVSERLRETLRDVTVRPGALERQPIFGGAGTKRTKQIFAKASWESCLQALLPFAEDSQEFEYRFLAYLAYMFP